MENAPAAASSSSNELKAQSEENKAAPAEQPKAAPPEPQDDSNSEEDGFSDEISAEDTELEHRSSLHPVVSGFNNLSILRQVGLLVGLAATIAMALAVVFWSREPSYQPLITNLDDYDTREVIEILQREGIAFDVNPASNILFVRSDEVHQARLKLAGAGIAGEKIIGFELLDQEQGLGTSQFMERTRFKRGLEGELARTISSIRAVRNARVHLAIPKESVFVRDVRNPTASVLVELYSGYSLDKKQVKAITNLVATSVPDMKIDDVTVVDQKGTLLSKDDSEDPDQILAQKQFEYTRKLEDVLMARINSILEPIVGSNNFKAEVSADVDFTVVEQTAEQFNPDLPALRSEQTLNEERINRPDGGVPGALSNQPPGEVTVPEEVDPETGEPLPPPLDRRAEATRNFELDRTLSYTQHQVGRVRRLTVAVVVNDFAVNGESGEAAMRPWSAEELERLKILVQDSVGYNAARGDSINVINSSFVDSDIELGEPPFWNQPWFWDLIKQVLGGIFVLILLFGVLRPALRSLMNKDKDGDEAQLGDESDLDSIPDITDVGSERITLSSGEEFLLPGASESFERQLEALKGLIAEDPARVAQVVKRWVIDDGG